MYRALGGIVKRKQGCFYGCAVHESDKSAIEKAIQKFGIEPWVAYWSEQVFEGLPQKLALNWPVELLDAMIQFEGDYKDIFHKLSIKRLENLPNTNDENVNQAIKKVIEYHLNPTEDKRKEAHSAGRSAAHSAARRNIRHVRRHGGRIGVRCGGRFGGKFGTDLASSALWAADAADAAGDAAARSQHWENERKVDA